jgi:putative ATPase
LRQQAQRLPDVERPAILVGTADELDTLLDLRGEADVTFDRILARNPLTDFDLQRMPFAPVVERLGDGRRFCLAQIVPRHGQRLYELVDWSGAAAELADRVQAAEEEIYGDAGDPMVNWDVADLEQALRRAGFSRVHVETERQKDERRLTSRHLERWFEVEMTEDGRPSYGARLGQAGLTTAEVEAVAHRYRRQLEGATVTWHSTVATVVAEGE